MQSLGLNFRYAYRLLAKNIGQTTAIFLTLALGIGASSAIFSIVYGVLLRPLPYAKPDQIVRLWEVNSSGQRINFADPNFEDVRSESHSLDGLAEFSSGVESVSGGAQPVRIGMAAVSRDFLSLMRIQPALGRGFVPDEQRFGAAPVALVGSGYWKQFLGGTAELDKLKLTILNHSVSVIGVLPPGFDFPDHSEIWIPRELFERLPSRSAHNWQVIGRLRDGVTTTQARTELSGIARRLKQDYGRDADLTDVALARLQEELSRPVRSALFVLLALLVILAILACYIPARRPARIDPMAALREE